MYILACVDMKQRAIESEREDKVQMPCLNIHKSSYSG